MSTMDKIVQICAKTQYIASDYVMNNLPFCCLPDDALNLFQGVLMSSLTHNLPKPTDGQRRLFLKAGCPFCTKLAVFISAAGLQDKFKPIYDCPPVREYVASVNNGKCTFPAMELEPEKSVMLETSDIIDQIIKEHGVDVDSMWTYNYFADGLLRSYSALFGYLVKKEGGYPGAREWFANHSDIIKNHCPPEGASEIA